MPGPGEVLRGLTGRQARERDHLAQVRTGSLIENDDGTAERRSGFDSPPVAGLPSRVPGTRVVRLRSPRHVNGLPAR
jgi:hypothetical protein